MTFAIDLVSRLKFNFFDIIIVSTKGGIPLSKNKILDTALSVIDNHIHLDRKEITRKIYAETGYCDQDYNKFLSVVSSGVLTLGSYIRKRKIYFAACELANHKEKPIADIAQDYGYSEQSAFSRAVKNEYEKTPAEIRKNNYKIPDNRLNLENYVGSKSRLDIIFQKLESCGVLWGGDVDYFKEFIRATDEFGFDISTCCLISELSERLDIPFSRLISKCFDMMIDYKDEIPPSIEFAIKLGIHSDEELEAICEYYKCDCYELTLWHVWKYQEKHKT